MATPFGRMPPTPHGQSFLFDSHSPSYFPNPSTPLGPSSPAALAGGRHGQSPSLAGMNIAPPPQLNMGMANMGMFMGNNQPPTPGWGRGFHNPQGSMAIPPGGNPLGNFKRGGHQNNPSLAMGMGGMPGMPGWNPGGGPGHQPRPSLSLNTLNNFRMPPQKRGSLAPPPMTPGGASKGSSPGRDAPSTPLPVLPQPVIKQKKVIVRLPRESLEALSPRGNGFIIAGFSMWSRSPRIWNEGEIEGREESVPPEIKGADENPELVCDDGLPPTLDM
ncbi:hypothetical protein BT69DRAFT_96542 [Atractiella rhizophila]|nr:hypothetical protein BT69DRAFT_96542 [Atractiella rhizophila]